MDRYLYQYLFIMKKLLTAVLLLLSLNLYSGIYISSSGKNVDIIKRLYSRAAIELLIDTTVINVYVCFILPSESSDMNSKGQTSELGNQSYIINISNDLSRDDLKRVFIHELIHVKQCIDKRLVIRKSFIWFEGIRYDNSIPVENRPYEIEAQLKTEDLYFQIK
jgi:hypothetical protein